MVWCGWVEEIGNGSLRGRKGEEVKGDKTVAWIDQRFQKAECVVDSALTAAADVGRNNNNGHISNEDNIDNVNEKDNDDDIVDVDVVDVVDDDDKSFSAKFQPQIREKATVRSQGILSLLREKKILVKQNATGFKKRRNRK